MKSQNKLLVGIATLLFAFAVTSDIAAQDKIDFDSQIRPIFSDRCFACHGPDEADRHADLRLDERESATRESEYGEREYVIMPGQPDESELLLRLLTDDEDIKMPPPESHLNVSPEETKLIRRWIAEGAEWTEHWAYEPIASVALPKLENNTWARNDIDSFVFESFAKTELKPNQVAGKATLARRLYFDLTGLPPTIDELENFLANDSDDAYEKLVDELFARKAYGERMAVEWLDVARYSDTHGYQLDFEAHVWPYRDWVINAFNDNLPFDDFITWQIAGDLLPNPSKDQILATAFNRLHRQTNEGGSVAEEFRLEYVADRVDTLGVAFLGLSVGCARCHDHKFDPISQKEYYELSAFFDNIDEVGVFAYFTKATPTPALDLPTTNQLSALKKLDSDVKEAESELESAIQESRQGFDQWLSAESDNIDWNQLLRKDLIGHFDFELVIEKEIADKADEVDEKDEVEKADSNQETNPEKKNFVKNRIVESSDGEIHEQPKLVPGKDGKGLLLSGDNGFTSSVTKHLTRHDPFSFSFWMNTGPNKNRATILHTTLGSTDSGNRGIDLVMIDGKLNATMCHFWPGNAMRVKTIENVPTNKWVHVGFTYDGSSKANGMKLFFDGELAKTETVKDQLTRTILHLEKDKVGFNEGNVPSHLTIGYRYRDRGFKNGKIDELKVYDRELCKSEIKHLSKKPVVDPERDDLLSIYLASQGEELNEPKKALKDARVAYSELAESVESVMVMQESSQPRKTYLLNRGAYDSPGEEVTPGVISKLLPFGEDLPANRLGLALWLTDPRHPLTSRVAVNRIWQIVMGRGLVGTQEDFGSQGGRPSHPELLDYLSNDFVQSGWDVKRLMKKIVMSSTYRQSSTCSPEMLERDPENEMLARGPSRRLTAEMIRDSALAASGLLVSKVGGPPVKPYQPLGLWKESMNIDFERDVNEGSRRRSIYSYWKRTLPPPSMITFDAAKRDVCTARREATATPLQALVLLNDPQYVEAARSAAQNSMLNFSEQKQRFKYLFRSFTGRTPSEKQIEMLAKTYDEQLEYFKDSENVAEKFLSIGDLESEERLDRNELAALTVVAQLVLNLDYFVMKR